MTDANPPEPDEPDVPRPAADRPPPRGCNPLVFGVVMATIQMAVLLYFMRSC